MSLVPSVAHRTCPLCEAACGLEVTVDRGHVARVRGDRDDVLSRGHVCPKGLALGELQEDPDRLRARYAVEPTGAWSRAPGARRWRSSTRG